MAGIALGHVTRPYPHKLDHVWLSDADATTPRQQHPIFFGSFDWHSCVHGWWTLLTLRRLFPVMAEAGAIDLWAVHPGGRSVLDAVAAALALPEGALADSREVLRTCGNMSSATILFVLRRIMAHATAGQRGCGMAFGPGLTAETMLFTAA